MSPIFLANTESEQKEFKDINEISEFFNVKSTIIFEAIELGKPIVKNGKDWYIDTL